MLTQGKVSDGGPQGSVSCPCQCFYPRLGTRHGAYIQQHIELWEGHSLSITYKRKLPGPPLPCGAGEEPRIQEELSALMVSLREEVVGTGTGLVCRVLSAGEGTKRPFPHRMTILRARPLCHAGVWKGVGEQWQGDGHALGGPLQDGSASCRAAGQAS